MDLLKEKDIEFAQNLYNKISSSKVQFIELLDNILDLATFVTVCTAEYGANDFAGFEIDKLIADEINNILSEYRIKIVVINGNGQELIY